MKSSNMAISRILPPDVRSKSQMRLLIFMRLAFAPWLLMVLPFALSARSEPLTSDTDQDHYFPDSQLVLEMAILSDAVYHLRNKVQSCHDDQARNRTLIDFIQAETGSSSSGDNQTEPQDIYEMLLPKGARCLDYSHDYSLGTQVLVVRSSLHNYVAVSYAGTDDWRTALKDGDVLTGDFGPSDSDDIGSIFKDVPDGVRVHRGFNQAVFDNDGFRKILNCVSSAKMGGNCDSDISDGAGAGAIGMDRNLSSAPYQLFTTGHSLGAADSVLLGAALYLTYPNETLRSINFGCPKIGNARWSFWINSLQPDNGGQMVPSSVDTGGEKRGSLEVFRFVNKIDLVPRLPEQLPPLTHAGHTLQMSAGGKIKAYYDHLGNDDLGYVGVPFGWEAAPFALLPFALVSHISHHYVDYFDTYISKSDSTNASLLYLVHDFERAEDSNNVVSSFA
mmetsp:Transcript_12429/g.30383  ORF Transcript_12429/g.30383 Transcript_12429/m.30383 type:complete len:447 (-) Transcript_12429:396-1736(-)